MTTEQKQLSAIVLGAILIILPTLTWFGGYHRGYADAEALPRQSDTVYKVKTVTIEKPVPVVKWNDREKPVYVPVNKDSLIYVHDTTFMPVPREVKQYSGENYTAQISGFSPSLDWINIQQKTAYITNTVIDKRRWTFGITAGPGIIYNGQFHGGIGVVAGLQYNF